jgi:hypothetical protein
MEKNYNYQFFNSFLEKKNICFLSMWKLILGYDKVVIWRKVYDLFKVDVKVYDFL